MGSIISNFINMSPIQGNALGHSVKRGLIALVAFGLPFLLTTFPTITSLSIGAVLTAIARFVEAKLA